jgi:hypothetical protein
LAALHPLLGGQGVADVVLPPPVDGQVALGHPFVAQVQLLGHPPAGRVAGDDGDLDAVEAEVVEGEAGDGHQRLGHVAVPGLGLVDPVAHVGVLERAALDAGQVDLPGQGAVHEDPEAVAGAELPLALPGPAPGVERRLALGVVGLAGRRLGLPFDQPVAVALAHLPPGVEVGQDQGPQQDPPAAQLGGKGAGGHEPDST